MLRDEITAQICVLKAKYRFGLVGRTSKEKLLRTQITP